MNRKRETANGHPVLGGMASIKRTTTSGAYWQFYMWIAQERRTFRKSLRTTDFESAMEAAKDLCLELHHKVKSGKKLFGMRVEELVAEFVKYKSEDVSAGFITPERIVSIKSYLKPFVRFKGAQTLVGELDRKAAYSYAQWRRAEMPSVKDATIRNEQATINMMMKFAYREGYLSFEAFEFARLLIREPGRRDTFTLGEYAKLQKCLAKWINDGDRSELAQRRMIQDCILFASHSMLRVGEYRQLRWKDVVSFDDNTDEAGRRVCLVQLNVRAETSKTRKSRTITTRGGEFLKRLRDRTPDWQPDDYVFCGASGSQKLSEKRCNDAWAELMSAMGINYKARNLTWYSLRHYAITRLLTLGVPIWVVAEIAGTSVTYIQKHYGHVDQKVSRDAALKALRRRDDQERKPSDVRR